MAFRAIKDVAGRTLARRRAELPATDTLSGKAAVERVGLAPLAKSRRRGRRVGGCSILSVSVGVVRRHDSGVATFHRKRLGVGKPTIVARVVFARKLLMRLGEGPRR